MIAPTGAQLLLADGRQEAVVCEVGATLRRYDLDGRPVCWGFDEDEMSTGGRGQVLAPWPNRLEDGTYEHDGVPARAAIDEPDRQNAIHGLVRWRPWTVLAHDDRSVQLACMLHHEPGYPFSVELELTYRLGPEGLSVTTIATNRDARSAPFGLGFHNYLHAGEGTASDCRLSLPAGRHVLSDERMLPCGEEPIETTSLGPLTGERPGAIGDLVLDDCCTGLATGADGRWRARFVPSGGEADAVTLWADRRFSWVMVFTGDTLSPGDRRRGVAIEPMTCPANAFRSKDGLVVLAPGESVAVEWGLAPDRLAS